MYKKCVDCKQEFSNKNTHSKDGWAETQISGLCEDCFDRITEDNDEPDSVDYFGASDEVAF